MRKLKMPMRDGAAKLAVQGLLMFNTPALFDRLFQMNWYGGVLRQWVQELVTQSAGEVLEIGCGPSEGVLSER